MKLPDVDSKQMVQVMGLVGPVVGLIAVRLLLGSGPADAPAAVNAEGASQVETVVEIPTPKLSTQQQAALAWIESHPIEDELTSPMYRESVMAEPEIEPMVDAVPEIEPLANQCRLSSTAGKGNRRVASINGRLYRIGEEVADGWFIVDINVEKRTVMCRHSSGIEEELSADRRNNQDRPYR